MKSTAYEQAGVSLDTADEVVDMVKPLAQRTFRPGVIGGVGGFGGLFHLDPNKWKNPVLVSGTDGVGTKLKLAYELEKHCLLYTSPSPRDLSTSRMPSSA